MPGKSAKYYVEKLLELARAAPAGSSSTTKQRGPIRVRGPREPAQGGEKVEPPPVSRRGPVRTRGRPMVPSAFKDDAVVDEEMPRPDEETQKTVAELCDEVYETRIEALDDLLRTSAEAEKALLSLVAQPGDPDVRIRWQVLSRIPKMGNTHVAVRLATAIAMTDPDELVRAEAVLQLASLGQNIDPRPSVQDHAAITGTLDRIALTDGSAYVSGEARNALRMLQNLSTSHDPE